MVLHTTNQDINQHGGEKDYGGGVLALLASGLHRMAAGDIKMFGNVSDERNTFVRTNEKAG